VSKLTIKFLYDYVDEALWRMSVYYTMNALNAIGHNATTANVLAQPIGTADVYVFYRCVTPKAMEAMWEARTKGFVVYAMDDYLFQPGCLLKWKINPEDYYQFFRAADAVTMSSQFLLDKVDVPRKFRYYTTIDRESFELLGKREKADSSFAIGWLAGHSRQGTDSFVNEILINLNDRLSLDRRCIFHQFGRHPMMGPFTQVKIEQHPYVPVSNWKELYRQFASLGLDVSLCPLPEDDEFAHGKSELKFVEAGAMGVPLIASRMRQFDGVIRDGENGFFASTPEEFTDKILRLMNEPGLAKQLGDKAKEQVEKECLAPARTQQWLEGLNRVMGEVKTKREAGLCR